MMATLSRSCAVVRNEWFRKFPTKTVVRQFSRQSHNGRTKYRFTGNQGQFLTVLSVLSVAISSNEATTEGVEKGQPNDQSKKISTKNFSIGDISVRSRKASDIRIIFLGSGSHMVT